MKANEKTLRRSRSLYCFIVMIILCIAGYAFSEVKRCKGQTVYVPVYSHIYHGDNDKFPILLTATLSIRNTDPEYPMTITAADYYDTVGKYLRSFIQPPIKLNPMGSTRFIVDESDKSGGSGANFIVKWESEHKITLPIIETVMIGSKAQQGISFTSRGQAIKEID